MKNKIIYIIDPQSVNSLATYDRNMIENIVDIKIHFFGNLRYNEKVFNPNVVFTPVFNYGKYSNSILKGLSYLMSLINIIFWSLKEHPSLFHMQWIRLWKLDWFFIKTLKGILKSKFVFTVHNILPRKRGVKTFSQYYKLYHFADKLIVHTDTTKKELEKKFSINPSKVTVMPHGILALRVPEDEMIHASQNFNNKYDLEEKIVFGSLGVQNPYKGTDLLINAWINSPYLANAQNAILLIAGKPSGLDIPKNLPNNVIVIPRLLSNAEFKYLMYRTDVMVLPYREIEQSGVLLSLINEEKPYCCTRAGELINPIIQEDIGWIIEDNNENTIESTLVGILNNPEIIIQKKNNKKGWLNLKKEYSWSRSNEILREAYLDLLKSKV